MDRTKTDERSQFFRRPSAAGHCHTKSSISKDRTGINNADEPGN